MRLGLSTKAFVGSSRILKLNHSTSSFSNLGTQPSDRQDCRPGRVSRTSAQNAIREAVRRGHITVEHRPVKGRKNLTNIIRILTFYIEFYCELHFQLHFFFYPMLVCASHRSPITSAVD